MQTIIYLFQKIIKPGWASISLKGLVKIYAELVK